MSRSGLVLAAHGSHAEQSTNHQLLAYAEQIVTTGLFDEVAVAFHQGEPTFGSVLDEMTADEITVVPVMTSQGYYCDVVLPRELARNRRYEAVAVARTSPVGTHPEMVNLVAGRVAELLRSNNLASNQTCLAVVCHGTKRHELSGAATIELVEALGRRAICAEVLAAFLDEDPRVETICDRSTLASILVVPFLIGGGPHATQDIPRRLGLTVTGTASASLTGHVDRRLVVCDVAVGTNPRILQIIIDLACVVGRSS